MSDETKANEPPEFEDHPSQQRPQRRRQPLRTREPSEQPEFEETQPISYVEVPKAPPIPPEHMTDTQAVNQATGTAPLPGSITPAAARSPWPMRIISAMIIIAMAAIILVLVLPRERTEGTLTQGTPDAAGPAKEGQFGMPQETAGGGDTQMPQATVEGQTGTTYTNAEAYDSTGQQLPAGAEQYGIQMVSPEQYQQQAQGGQETGQTAQQQGSTPAPYQGQAPAPAQQQQQATPSPAPVPAPNPAPELSRQDEKRLQVLQDRTTDAGDGNQISEGDLRLLIGELRKAPYQDPDFWGIMQMALGMELGSRYGGSMPGGIQEILGIINQAPNGETAALWLEQRYNNRQR